MFHVKLCCGALAGLLLAAGPAMAQDAPLAGTPSELGGLLAEGEVRLTAPGLRIQGRALGFDGRFLRVETETGELTLDTQALACEGAACPETEGFVPELRLSGDADLGEVLLPALVEGFAAAQGWDVERAGTYILREDGREVLRLSLRLSTTTDGIADLLSNEADLAVLARAPLPQETERLVGAGLGETGELRLRLLAQGALVPVTGPGQRVGRITLEDLARVYAGEVTSWADLGGEDVPVRAHLGPDGSALAQAFVAEVLDATGRELSP